MKFFSSSKDGYMIFKILQLLSLLPILKTSLNGHIQILNICLIVFLAINDYFARDFSEPIKYISYILSNLIICYLLYKFKTYGASFYYILMVVDLIILNKKILKSIVIVNFISNIISNGILYSNNLHVTITNALSSYALTLIICFLIRRMIIEKKKKTQLYEELKENNLTLKEYSRKIEELTITKERTRIAQELHDSMGHSLVALSMNLEYTENIIDIKPGKAKITIQNCYSLSKDCLNNLREAVSVLKENSTITLKNDIDQIFLDFKIADKYEFNLDFDETVEKVDSKIKTCIYKTLREAITNGIKHGNATSFNIHIYKSSKDIIFKIENNGSPCKEIVPSNGIIGMEERIHLLNGEITFYSEDKDGFTIEGKIPENIIVEGNS
ncbi:sensor histidine kinase [Clostridium akagii]|uniref:sensor histidine kinase n=1 Tax=Clostridium akagii TaxID=91623 RepID=UPI00047D24B3|nr:sensor histidine kinase [Clostridium akagii]